MPVGRVEPFNSEEENWEEYVERMEEYFVANDITDKAKKRSTLLCNIGSKAYGIVRSLLSPVKPAAASYSQIVEKLTGHFSPQAVCYRRDRYISRRDDSRPTSLWCEVGSDTASSAGRTRALPAEGDGDGRGNGDSRP